MELEQLYIYDIETFPNIFTLCIANAGRRRLTVFEISDRKNDYIKMMEYLTTIYKDGGYMVGYNNLGFDYPVLHHIMRNKNCQADGIYSLAMEIIETDYENRFANTVPDYKQFIKQIDLFKVHHFDNVARATSLKVLEFNMRSDNIEDLPFPVGTVLSDDQKDILIEYNKHDVKETCKFLSHSMDAINFREKLTLQYDRNFMNHNDGKIGKDYFIMKLEEEIPGSCYKMVEGKRQINQTKRKSIDLVECIFPYVQFERPEFNALLEWLKRQTITETKGVFTDILESDLGELAKYAHMRTRRQKQFKKPTESQLAKLRAKHPMGWLSEELLKSGKVSYYWNWNAADNVNVVVDGFQYDIGTGGIHGSVTSQVVRSDDEYIIIDQDVASYYPNMGISNRIYPEHLSEQFCDIYLDVYQQRKSYAKGTPENAMLKLALNSVYGDSNSKFSPFYDPKYTMSITIGGQLSLCMLAEMLLKVEGLQIIQVNTDGLTYRIQRDKKQEAQDICDEWEKIVKLELESAEYDLMAIRDVNNYLARTVDGKIKRKGAYSYIRPDQPGAELGWHSNHSALVVPMAAEQALLYDEEISYFIKKHKDKLDFMLRAKVPRTSRLVVHDKDTGEDTPTQNIIRYYVCKEGEGELVKIMPPLDKPKLAKRWKGIDKKTELPDEQISKTKTEEERWQKKGYEMVEEFELPPQERRIGINTGWRVKICNNINDFCGDIDYDYYVNEAKKLVDPLLEGV